MLCPAAHPPTHLVWFPLHEPHEVVPFLVRRHAHALLLHLRGAGVAGQQLEDAARVVALGGVQWGCSVGVMRGW